MKEKVICGIQQVGIGVKNVQEAWSWYKDNLGFETKVFDDEGVAERMLPYTGGRPQPRHAYLAINMRGGGGLEIWEPQGRELNWLDYVPELGDIGIFACKIKSPDPEAAYRVFREKKLDILSPVKLSPSGKKHFFMKDPYGNLLDIEEDSYCFLDQKKVTGGNNGVTIGVSDIGKSVKFYGTVADYDKVEYDVTGVFDDLDGVPGCGYKVRRVMLCRSKPLQGPLCEILGTSHIELVQRVDEGAPAGRKLYEGRFWGDPGFIHLCFDIRNMDKVGEAAASLGHKFVCDGGRDFAMGDANGHFTYVEDPDGTLIEFVETFKIPVFKKFGLFLNLGNKDDYKPLPRWMTSALRFL